jgi:hypothetical protein
MPWIYLYYRHYHHHQYHDPLIVIIIIIITVTVIVIIIVVIIVTIILFSMKYPAVDRSLFSYSLLSFLFPAISPFFCVVLLSQLCSFFYFSLFPTHNPSTLILSVFHFFLHDSVRHLHHCPLRYLHPLCILRGDRMLHSRFEWASATVRPHARGGRAYREVLEEQAARSGTASLYQVGRGSWVLILSA